MAAELAGSRIVPKAGAIAGAIDCEIIELHSHGPVGVERNVYVPLKPKADDTTVGSGRTGNLNKLSSGSDILAPFRRDLLKLISHSPFT